MSPRKPMLRGGIDLGGTKIQAVVVDSKWNVVGSSRRPTPTEGEPKDVAEQMSDALREAALDAGARPSELAGAGVGSPGDVNETTGAVSQARNLPGWDGTFKLGPWLTKSLGTQVSVGNDVGVATEAEAKLGAGRPYSSLIGVFWGTGVGGGIILNGEHWLGRGAAGGLGVRFGEPYVKRIRKAMAPHLFNDQHSPALHVAALGDFGGAIGAALLAANRAKKGSGRGRTKAPKAPAASGDGAAAASRRPISS